MSIQSINTVYDYLRAIGAGKTAEYWITEDLRLITKPRPSDRLVEAIRVKIFGRKKRVHAELSAVIKSVKRVALTATEAEKNALIPKERFILLALNAIRSGYDPHFKLLSLFNKFTAHSLNGHLKELSSKIEKRYRKHDFDLELTLRCALRELALSTGSEDPNRKMDRALFAAIEKSRFSCLVIDSPLCLPCALFLKYFPYREEERDLENIDYYLSRGASINSVQERTTYTPLILAAYHGFPDMVAHLLQRGANPKQKNRHGKTALDIAKEYLDKYTARKEETDSQAIKNILTIFITRYRAVVQALT